MHYHESRVLMSKDGLQVKTYANEHPPGKIIVKPKYIPTDKIKCEDFQQRVLNNVPVNRLNVWIDQKKFGKKNYMQVIEYLKSIKNHKYLRWKTKQEWIDYYNTYNQGLNFSQEEFIWHVSRKCSDGFFGDKTVLSLFGVEEHNEVAIKWGD